MLLLYDFCVQTHCLLVPDDQEFVKVCVDGQTMVYPACTVLQKMAEVGGGRYTTI